MSRKEEKKETLTGLLERVRFSSANGFTVGELKTRDGKRIPVVGKLVGIRPGDTLELEGSYVEDPRFGHQFQIVKARAIFPEDDIGAFRFLERLPFVGQHRAHKLLQTFGRKETFAILDDPTRMEELAKADPGFTPSRQAAIYRAYHDLKKEWGAKDSLGRFGLSDAQIGRALKVFGKDATEKIQNNPFLLTELPGITFKDADQIAQAMGFSPDSPVRLRGALLHILKEEELGGHTYLSEDDLILKTARLLEVDWEKTRDVLLAFLEEEGAPLARSGEGRVHLRELRDAELEISAWIGA